MDHPVRDQVSKTLIIRSTYGMHLSKLQGRRKWKTGGQNRPLPPPCQPGGGEICPTTCPPFPRIIRPSYGPAVPFYTAMFVRLLGIKRSVRKNYTLTLQYKLHSSGLRVLFAIAQISKMKKKMLEKKIIVASISIVVY